MENGGPVVTDGQPQVVPLREEQPVRQIAAGDEAEQA